MQTRCGTAAQTRPNALEEVTKSWVTASVQVAWFALYIGLRIAVYKTAIQRCSPKGSKHDIRNISMPVILQRQCSSYFIRCSENGKKTNADKQILRTTKPSP